ncbi:response regulator [Hydrogenophaga sp. PAMC20947]|uniref:response regulator n=1 Tax=Hydrogenophaga sp. PAMC20947 TaxID=2565558 RepID=UPI00109DF79B|nr:response regulator [Hydrogenophaga sp. PAMC20947]QCB44682.1 response regulator [Hydrogenophaga sp. PAMC20947]
MKNWRDWSIARKLGWLLAFNTGVVVLVVAMVFTVGTAFSRFVEAREQVSALAGMVGENVRAALAFDDPDSALRTLQALQSKEEVADAVLTNAKGEVFAQVSFQDDEDNDTLESLVRLFSGGKIKVSHQIVDGSVPLGRVDLSIRLSAIWIELVRGLLQMTLIAVSLGALAVLLGTRLHRFLSVPILDLARVSNEVSREQDFSLRAVKVANDEVGALVDGFNGMLSEIEARDEALRQERATLEQRVEQRTADLSQAMEEAERANRVKSEFLSTVSHELRTPLTAIAGSIGLLSGGALGALPPAIQGMLDIAQKNSQRLTFLINDLLDMEKLLAGKLHFDMVGQELMPLVEQSLADNQAYGGQYGVRYVLARRLNGVSVEVDAQRLQQVMANLLSNAAKFSPANAVVTVEVGMHQGRVRVSVHDKGEGVPAEFQTRIFQKFSQADASDTRQKGGTGLGLAITRELVERMDGEVGFYSDTGQGACFYFELPLWNPYLSRPAPIPALAGLDNRPRVLVVEDDTDVADLLSMMLREANYSVDIVVSGAEALAYARRKPYAAISLDLRLPDGSGLDVIRTLRAEPGTALMPIVVVAAKMDEGRRELGRDFPGIEWLAKPIDQAAFIRAIDRSIDPDAKPLTRVLHVEDDRELHEAVREMAGRGFEFALAVTLREARARVALQQFDVVILDLALPDASGWALLPDIRANQPNARVVVLTGTYVDPDLVEQVDTVLHKSKVSPQALLEAMGADRQTSRWGELMP